MTHLPPKINLFFMKLIFIDSYKTIEEYYGAIFPKLSDYKSEVFFSDLLQNWYIYHIYPP